MSVQEDPSNYFSRQEIKNNPLEKEKTENIEVSNAINNEKVDAQKQRVQLAEDSEKDER